VLRRLRTVTSAMYCSATLSSLRQPRRRAGRVQVKEAEQAFQVIVKNDAREGVRSMAAYRFRAHMLQCMGQHAAAEAVLAKALESLNGKMLKEQRVECLYLRGAPPGPLHHIESTILICAMCLALALHASLVRELLCSARSVRLPRMSSSSLGPCATPSHVHHIRMSRC
jgi:hypothetical protein